jgi:hypothetical protein
VSRSLIHLRQVLSEKANFNPDQPRLPRGDPEGGQWTTLAGVSAKDRCIDKCYRLLERPEPRGMSQMNYWDFQRCLARCLAKADDRSMEGMWTAISRVA